MNLVIYSHVCGYVVNHFENISYNEILYTLLIKQNYYTVQFSNKPVQTYLSASDQTQNTAITAQLHYGLSREVSS